MLNKKIIIFTDYHNRYLEIAMTFDLFDIDVSYVNSRYLDKLRGLRNYTIFTDYDELPDRCKELVFDNEIIYVKEIMKEIHKTCGNIYYD